VSVEPEPAGQQRGTSRPLWGPPRRVAADPVPSTPGVSDDPPTGGPGAPVVDPRPEADRTGAPPSPGGGSTGSPAWLPPPSFPPPVVDPPPREPAGWLPPPAGDRDLVTQQNSPPSYLPPPRPVSPTPPPRPAPSRATSLTRPAVVAGVAVAVLVLVGGVIWAAVGGARTSTPPGTGAANTAAFAAPPTAARTVVPDTTSDMTPTTAASTVLSASGIVTLDPGAAAAPSAPTVMALLDRYFTAINARDYPTWASSVDPKRAQHQPLSSWLQAYRSTNDQAVEVSAITPSGGDAVTVELSFTSTQDIADAPSDLQVGRICWRSAWPVVDLSSGGRINSPPSGTTTKSAC